MDYETAEFLIESAKANGFELSHRQLAELHRRGILPHPRKVGLGGAGGGSESRYPPGTRRQLLAACELMKRFPRDYNRVGWELWLRNFSVGARYWKTPLRRAEQQVRLLGKLFERDEADDGPPIISELGERAIAKAASLARPKHGLRLVRRRLTSGILEEVVAQILQTMVGGFEVPTDEGRKEWDFRYGRLLGVVPGVHKRKPSEPLSVDVAPENFLEMLTKLNPYFRKLGKRQTWAAIDEQTFRSAALAVVRAADEQLAAPDSGVLSTRPNINQLGARIFSDLAPSRHALAAVLWLVSEEARRTKLGESSESGSGQSED